MTDLYGIMAHPVAHSLSPAMHNAAFESLGLDARFEAFDVPPEKLTDFWAERTDVKGFAVSLPHKEAILPLLDGIEPEAIRIGAVNTVFWKEGKRWGENTDAPGFLDALSEVMPTLEGKNAVILGAGGAAKAVVAALQRAGAGVTVLNRTLEKAEALGQQFGVHWDQDWSAIEFVPDLIVNTTTVGLHPESEIELVPPERWAPGMVAFDAVYRRDGLTRFLQEALRGGAQGMEGRSMLLHQGMRQFERWTGQAAPREVMEEALYAA